MSIDLVNEARQARTSPNVPYSEYLKMRSRHRDFVFVFEGKQCPVVYTQWLSRISSSPRFEQIIARNKKGVIGLRELIRKNDETTADRTFYFMDRDFDDNSKFESESDIYLSDGYAIENELFAWEAIEGFLRANYDIADADDAEAVNAVKDKFEILKLSYIFSSSDLQKCLYVCRKASIHCTPGEDLSTYLSIDFEKSKLQEIYGCVDELLSKLGTRPEEREVIKNLMEKNISFELLNPIKFWRGKFHFDFIKRFLSSLRDARVSGAAPFKRASKTAVDPDHSGLLGLMASFAKPPAGLIEFIQNNFSQGKACLRDGELKVDGDRQLAA